MNTILVEIDHIVQKIVEHYSPEAIILFGSLASEQYGIDSDIDLLVIKKTSKKPIWRRVEVRKIVKSDFPIDIIVITPEEFLRLKQSRSPFLSEILKTGKILYEKDTSKNSHLLEMDEIR